MITKPLNTGLPAVELMGMHIHVIERQGLLAHIKAAVESGQSGFINSVNIHAMNLAWEDTEFRNILNQSDLLFVDGYGVILGAKIAGLSLGERLTFDDWMDDLYALCVAQDWSLFWLGDTEEVGEAFESRLRERYPSLRFAGRHSGFFSVEGAENEAVVAKVNASGADILLVGMGMPRQEKWIWANRDRLKPAVTIASGGYARIATGFIPRGPRWMTQNGLEWLYRLCVQPGHTWRRYLLGNPLFLIRVALWRWLAYLPGVKR